MLGNVFSNRVIDNWNLLPASCVNCSTINTFKSVSVVIVGVIRRKPVLTHASIVCEGMLASVNSVNEDAAWYGGIGPRHNVLDGEPASLKKGHISPLPNFRPMSVVAKRMDGSRFQLVRR